MEIDGKQGSSQAPQLSVSATKLLKAALGFNAAALAFVLAGPLQFVRACLRGFNGVHGLDKTGLSQIPTIDLGDILRDRRPEIRLAVMKYEGGMLQAEQAMALLSILVAENPKEVLEIGTFMGHTTRQMAENLEGGVIHTLDLPEDFSPDSDPVKDIVKDDFHLIADRRVGREFKGQPCSQRIIQHFGDSATFDFKQLGNPTFFFIDGAHTYEYCKRDSEKCFELCGGRGVFLWHDCDPFHPGVIKFVHEWIAMGRKIERISGTWLAYWKSY